MERFLDIIKNNRIYYPTYKQLNDSLEGAAMYLINGILSIIWTKDDTAFDIVCEESSRKV